MASQSPLQHTRRKTLPASTIDTLPPMPDLGPRAASVPNMFGPTLSEAVKTPGLGDKAKALLDWWKHSRIGRGLARYSMKRGNLLAGGISYVALFSISGAVALGWTIFMAVLGGNEELRQSVLDAVNQAMPGLLTNGSEEGLLNPDSLVQQSPFSIGGLIALVILLFSSAKVMTALKMSLWSIFGIVRLPDNAVITKLRDLLGFLVIALGVVVTAVLGILLNTLGSQFLDLVGISGGIGKFAINFGSLLLALLVDVVVFVALLSFVAGLRIPAKDLWIGGTVFGVASGLLRFLGTKVVGAVDDPLLAGFTTIITLLLWINILARVTLMISAWIANPPIAPVPGSQDHMHGKSTPNYVTMSNIDTLDWPHHTMTGDIEPDPRYDPESEEIVISDRVWNSTEGKWLRKRIETSERRADKYRRKLWELGETRKVGKDNP
ncbi:MAG: YihY/virulence factor BrkB family protein [Actinomycetaceae bacterium]|nr:YihY/virulence factor BrkB family protein [Actinomycetaceae bacterium]